jgi:hypothetical protein
MGRLNSGGSSTFLRRSLFPQGFAGEVIALVLDTWQKFSLYRQVRLENRITAVFRDALIEAYNTAGRSWFIALEDPITDPDYGTELGRNDLRFYPPHHHGQTIFFTLECKRLRVPTKSGVRQLAVEYVEKGMQKFVDGKYSADHPCGGMLGYVMDNCLEEAFESVQGEIHKRRSVLKMKRKNSICVPSCTVPSHLWSLDTFHRRSDGELTVHHLLVGVAR